MVSNAADLGDCGTQEVMVVPIYRSTVEFWLYGKLPDTVRLVSDVQDERHKSCRSYRDSQAGKHSNTSPGDEGYCCLLSLSTTYVKT